MHAHRTQKPPHNTERKTVLLVEDHEDLRRITAERLKKEGFDVIAAASRLQALHGISGRTIHAAVVDWGLYQDEGTFLCAHPKVLPMHKEQIHDARNSRDYFRAVNRIFDTHYPHLKDEYLATVRSGNFLSHLRQRYPKIPIAVVSGSAISEHWHENSLRPNSAEVIYKEQ